MFLLFLRRSVLRGAYWLAKQACQFIYHNANLQAVILVPLIVVLLLLPAIFDSGNQDRSVNTAPQVSATSYSPTSYDQSRPAWPVSR